MRANAFNRIRIFSVALILVSVFCIARLYLLQIAHGDAYRSRADRQYVLPSQATFKRGSIAFEDKDGLRTSAATLRSGFLLAINPRILADAESAYERLGTGGIELDHDSFLQKAAKKDDPYEEILHRVPEELARPFIDEPIKGVQFFKEYWRFYPGEYLAAQTLGFVAFKGDDLIGRYGLEKTYEDTLKRTEEDVYVNSFAQFFSDVKNFVTPQSQEGDIVTTLEPSVQKFLEDELAATNKTWSSAMTGGVIMNPKTGEIYAMSSVPTFNPNSFQTEKDVAVYGNPLVENVYELGSIMKPLTMAAGLDTGVVTAATTYNDKGSIVVDGKKISNYDGRARGVIPMQEVLNQSLNVGMAEVVDRLGSARMIDYFARYGIGQKTGIDLPNEAPGLTGNLKNNREVEYVTASFGQGIALSPISITRALAVLGNGGTLVTPHVVKEINYTDSRKTIVPIEQGARVIKPETSKEITRMLVKVFDDALLGGTVKMPKYSIAAKTGTAQIAKPGGGYYDDRYLHSFFGYFPANDPKFIVFLYTVNPKGVDYASHTLTTPFIKIAKFLINYYQLPPDR